ncbi:MAG: MBL fold metallo-hydrolase [Verrucomicrobia bacterium]|nr:MBL fold metallo-hydrolase [Verrucomicrobiota bacterium]
MDTPSIKSRSAAKSVPKKTARKEPRKLSTGGAKKVGLKPGDGWHKRNFLTKVLIPSLFTPRSGRKTAPKLPKLKPQEIGLTWIGHASFLVQTPKANLLVDPNWAKWLKVIKRIRHPGMEIHDLPTIDLVLVTHAHFDHLDRRTLRRVAEGQPIIVPFEVGSLVRGLGFQSIHELDYWKSFEHGEARITLTPCHHWGARFLHDSHRGFGGYIVELGGRTIYHCGDTAFFDGFKEIGKRFKIDIALLPIGAYDPPSGREVHMNPEEALQAFLDLGAQRMVPMHYGSFRLSYEPPEEPLQRLLAAAKKLGIEDRVAVMTEGTPLVF